MNSGKKFLYRDSEAAGIEHLATVSLPRAVRPVE
jgi:hypothetical protein